MASIIDDLKRLYTQIEGGPQAQGSVLYEEPSPFASMARGQFSNQNYQGSQPLQERFTKELEENAARTAPTRGQQGNIAAEYFTGTPRSLQQAQQNLTNTLQTRRDIENMAASLQPANPFPTPAPLTMKPIPAGVTRTPAETVSNNTTAAIYAGGYNGTNMGNADRKAAAAQTLMGGDMGSFVSNLLRMFAQPEFQQAGFEGQGFGPTVLGATKALRAMETQDAEMEKARLEAAANVKPAGPGFELSSQSIELVDRITGADKALEAIQNLKKVLSSARVSGGAPAALQALRNFGQFFGVQLEAGSYDEYKMEVNKLKQGILASGIFGREATKAEYKILEDIVASPGLFEGDPVLLAKLRGLEQSFIDKKIPAERMLRASGVDTDNMFAANPVVLATKD
jgi:hypothetical protein